MAIVVKENVEVKKNQSNASFEDLLLTKIFTDDAKSICCLLYRP